MAINYTYPVKGQPVIEDEFLIVDTQDGNATKRVTVDSILDLGSGGDIGVSTFQATDGTFINYSPNGATTGTVTLTGDLSATGTPGATNFLRGDNTWSTAIREVNPGIGEPIAVSTTDGIAELSLSTVPTTKGGTGLTAIGTSHQVPTVNEAGTALEYKDATIIETVKNDTVSTILKGTPLYAKGWNEAAGVPEVGPANATNGATDLMPCIGLAENDIAVGQIGHSLIVGVLDGIKTNGYSADVGDVLYVAPGGGLTGIRPTGTNIIQPIAVILKLAGVGAGVLQVATVSQGASIPNVPNSQIIVGDASNIGQSVAMSGEVTISNTGVTEVTGIDGNVSIQGYSPVENLSTSAVSLSDEYFGKTLVLSNAINTDFSITDSSEIAVGTEVSLINPLSQITVGVTSPTFLNGGTASVLITERYGQATVKKIASGQYVIYGDIV